MKTAGVMHVILALTVAGASAGNSSSTAQVKSSTVSGNPLNSGPAGPKNLLQFLENPLDLVQYKKAKGISNNGAARKPAGAKTYHKPPDQGFYYQYFNFPIFGEEKRGDIAPREALGDIVVEVYKFGRTVGDYYDRREVLIELSAYADDQQVRPRHPSRRRASFVLRQPRRSPAARAGKEISCQHAGAR